MSRHKDIRAEVQGMVDMLYQLHDATDPEKGEASEEDKLMHAQHAISLWWLIYARLLHWAQSQIIGYEMARLNPACGKVLVRRRGKQLSEDSHELELLGSIYVANRPEHFESASAADRGRTTWLHPDGGLDALAGELENANVRLDYETLRRVIIHLLSTSGETSLWSSPLYHALRALDYGEVDDFFKPSRRRRRGQSYKLDCTRSDAIKHVRYLVGKGIKKYKAQETIGSAIGASVETLRTWEKELRKDDGFVIAWHAATIAGRIENGPDSIEDLPNTTIAAAVHVLQELHGECSLPKIRERLRKYHK